MKKKSKGKPWIKFLFNGLEWSVYVVPNEHEKLAPWPGEKDTVNGATFFDDLEIYINEKLSVEGRALLLAHEVEHVVEEWAQIEHELGCLSEAGADQRTDNISKGWVYLIRHAPELISLIKDPHGYTTT